jgi:8-oxo-dGTP diphosphatase
MTEPEIRAAGGVVVRDGLVAVIHRPRYDDWSLPKGKLDPGEDFPAAAVREVWEETGLRCRPGEELPEVRYADREGRPKLVRFWRMEVVDETPFAVNDEVDELRWVPLDEAARLLSHESDRRLIAALGDPGDAVVVEARLPRSVTAATPLPARKLVDLTSPATDED